MNRRHLHDLSVVIPTYRRPIYALRNMHLLDQTGGRVHVLDGSPEPIERAQLSLLSARVNYIHLPVPYEERMAHAVDLVDTPYCVSLSDDDMHLPSGLTASIRALRDDSELVSATGTALAVLAPADRKFRGKLIYDGLHGRAVVGDDPVERMVDHLGHYLPSSVYAVTRTPVWQRAMRAVTQKRFRPIRIGELQYEMTVAYAGKTTVVPNLMWLRSFENQPHWKTDDVPLAPWWEQAAASGERDEFAAYMGGALTDDVAKQAAAAQGALRAVDAYMRALTEPKPPPVIHPALPLTEWAHTIAKQGVAVDNTELSAAIAALEATPSTLTDGIPGEWAGPRGRSGLASRLGRRWRGSAG